MATDLEWYFAYGSNLDRTTFCGRRRMQPRDTRVTKLNGYKLVFDLPVGDSNRGVANVVPQSSAEVWGVAYQINRREGRRLDATEGVHRNFYRRQQVTLEEGNGETLRAFAYVSSKGRSGRLPSARYLGLLVNGAIYHQLPAHWIEALRAWPLAIDERVEKQRNLF